MKQIAQGAEAKIYLETSKKIINGRSDRVNAPRFKDGVVSRGRTTLRSNPKTLSGVASSDGGIDNNFVIKNRIPKSYRIQELDHRIRKQRTKAEAKILEKTKKIINVPNVQKVSEYEIKMDFIDGKKLSQELDNFSLKEQKNIMKKVGESVAKMHEAGIIHGDLTTSNMIYRNKKKIRDNKFVSGGLKRRAVGGLDERINSDFQIFFIDFGLSFQNGKIEDKGVDIHLLKQALEAKHFKNWKSLFAEFGKTYKKTNKKDSKQIFERLIAIERRGRYRH